jgi:hypothetical protein
MAMQEGESYIKYAKVLPPEVAKMPTVESWRNDVDGLVDPLKEIIAVPLSDLSRDTKAEKWLEDLTGYKSVVAMQAEDEKWNKRDPEDRKLTRGVNDLLIEDMTMVDQVAYLALQEFDYVDRLMSPGDFDNLLPAPLKGCGEAIAFYGVGNDKLRNLLSRTDLEYRSTRFNNYSEIAGYTEYLTAQLAALAEMDEKGDADFGREKQAAAVYYAQRIANANETLHRVGSHEVVIPKTKDEQLEQMRDAVRVFENLAKAPGEGLEIMDQTMVFNAYILDGTDGKKPIVHPEVLREMKARVKNLVVAKALKSAGGFMPSDRTNLNVVDVIERLRGTDDLLNFDDMDYFFGGLAEKNGLPVREIWDEREKLDFGTEYEELVKKIAVNYEDIKDDPTVKRMFETWKLPENQANFQKMMYEGIYIEVEDKKTKVKHMEWNRPVKDVPFFADRGVVFSEDSNALRKEIVKEYLRLEAEKAGGPEGANAFSEAWGIVDWLRFSTAEDIRARINLEGHYTVWEGMSGILNTLDRAAKLKNAADVYWVGQQIIQTGAPYVCYAMRHDIHTPLLSSEIDPLAFLDIKTDISYWSSWIKTTQKMSDYLTSGVDIKSLGPSLMVLHDAIAKSLKAPTIVNMGGKEGYWDNMARDPGDPKKFLFKHGRREIDIPKSDAIERRLKTLMVRQAVQALMNASYVSDGKDMEAIVEAAYRFKKEMTEPHYSDIEYGKQPALGVQPTYEEIAAKAEKMDAKKTYSSLAFMTIDEFDKILEELGLNKEKWKVRTEDIAKEAVKGLFGVEGGKKK